MKILHIIDGLGIGGAEKMLVETIPLLVEKSNKVDILLLNGEKTRFYEELEQTQSCNIFSLGKSFYNPLYIFKIIRYLSKYDIIHVHLFPAQYFAVIAKILCLKSGKFIFTEHNTSNRRLNNKMLRFLEKFIYSHYRKIICITPKVKKNLNEKLAIPINKLEVIENGINLQNIKNATKGDRRKMGYTENDILLIMVAAFREQKDQDTVVKLLNVLPENYKLILVGDGERREKVETLARALDLEKRINFLGLRYDVYSLYKMSNIAILSSHWEGFGLAAVEAMACGIPLIASNVDGLAQVVTNGGLLFEKNNVDSLKEMILWLENTNNYHKTVSRGIDKSEQFDINKFIDKTINIYYNI